MLGEIASLDSIKQLHERLKSMKWQSKLWKNEWREEPTIKWLNKPENLVGPVSEELMRFMYTQLSKSKDLEAVSGIKEICDKLGVNDGEEQK
jgi:hypothetical protein